MADKPMSAQRYMDCVYLDDPDAILLRLSNMAERLDGLTARIDHNTHARSDADHDYITLDVPKEEAGRIFAPVDGAVVAVSSTSVALAPTQTSQSMLYSPVTGRITAQLPSHNAIGLMTFDGVQLLVTVGRCPELYRGDAFRQLAWQNDSVHMGDPLVSWNRGTLGTDGESEVVTLTIMNTNEFGVELDEAVQEGRRLRTGSPLMRFFPI